MPDYAESISMSLGLWAKLGYEGCWDQIRHDAVSTTRFLKKATCCTTGRLPLAQCLVELPSNSFSFFSIIIFFSGT